MTAARGISKYGFRSWYERELLICHSYLVTALLALVLALLLVEQIDWRAPLLTTLLMLAGLAVTAVLGGGALHRYLLVLGSVLALADKCVCAQCRTYGIVTVVASGRAAGDSQPQWLRLQCGKCAYQWQVLTRLQ